MLNETLIFDKTSPETNWIIDNILPYKSNQFKVQI